MCMCILVVIHLLILTATFLSLSVGIDGNTAPEQNPNVHTCLPWPPQHLPIMMNHIHLAAGVNYQQ